LYLPTFKGIWQKKVNSIPRRLTLENQVTSNTYINRSTEKYEHYEN